MKQKMYLSFVLLLLLTSCSNKSQENSIVGNQVQSTHTTVTTLEVKDKSFNELFREIGEDEIPESVFKLVGKDFTVITAGKDEQYNSMLASWGGWGILFQKPVTWCFLRSNRYTLEQIRKNPTYTMSYFDDNFKDQIMTFGTSSGRDSQKMQNHGLTPVTTPSGKASYKEAKLIIECKLAEITTVSPDDFVEESSRMFITEAYDETKDYHKLVFGEITNIWIRK